MLLTEIVQIQDDLLVCESVTELCQYLRTMYDVAQDDSNDTNESYKAAQYLAYLMAYRDLDYVTKDTDNNPIKIDHFFQPGIKSTMKALQFFAKKSAEHSNITKKVQGYTTQFVDPQQGRKKFDYQLNKIEQYFKARESKKQR